MRNQLFVQHSIVFGLDVEISQGERAGAGESPSYCKWVRDTEWRRLDTDHRLAVRKGKTSS